MIVTTGMIVALVLFIIVSFYIIINKPKLCYMIFIASMPLETLIHDDFYSIPKIIGFLAVTAWLLSILRTRSKIIVDKTFYLLSLFVVYAAVSMYWTIDAQTTLSSLSTYVLLVLLYLLIINSITTANDIHWAMTALLICGLLLAGYGLYEMVYGGFLTTGRHYGLLDNPNITGLWYIATMPGFYYTFKTTRSKVIQTLILGAVILILYQMAYTLSRGAVISFFVFLTTALFFNLRKFKVILALICMGALFYMMAPDSLWGRFSMLEEVQGRGDDRMENLWPAGLKVWENSPLIGYGLGTNPKLMKDETGVETPVHSGPLAVAMELGAIGLAIYLLFLFSGTIQSLSNLFKSRKIIQSKGNIFYHCDIMAIAVFAAIIMTWFKGGAMEHNKIVFLFLGLTMALNSDKFTLLYKSYGSEKGKVG
jgi:O-antigen ligase